MVERHEVVIVGGGIMGATALFEFARRGIDALLLEAEPDFGGRDSSKTAGIIRTHYSNPDVVRMAIRGRELFREIPRLTDAAPVFHDIGYVFLASPSTVERARENVAMQRAQGAKVEELAASEIGRFAPNVQSSGIEALFYERESGYAEPVPAVRAFIAAAERHGASARAGVNVERLIRTDDRVTGVMTRATGGWPAGVGADELIEARTVVLAAGAWSKPLAATAGLDLPIEFSVEQELLLEVPEGDAPTASISNAVDAVYEHPELGRSVAPGQMAVLVGTGFPKAYPTGDPANYPGQDALPDLVTELRQRLAIRQPALAEAPLLQARLGLYDITPDWHPLLGPVPGLDGLLLFTGGSGHGFKIAPAMAEMLAGAYAGQPVDYADIALFSLDRFARGTSRFMSAYGGNRA